MEEFIVLLKKEQLIIRSQISQLEYWEEVVSDGNIGENTGNWGKKKQTRVKPIQQGDQKNVQAWNSSDQKTLSFDLIAALRGH